MKLDWLIDVRTTAFGVMLFCIGFGLGAQWAGRLATPEIGMFESVPEWVGTIKQVSTGMLIAALLCLAIIAYEEYRRGNIKLPDPEEKQ